MELHDVYQNKVRFLTPRNPRLPDPDGRHTHAYYRMRVLDPAGVAANDPNVFPDEEGGLYQIDAGAAGNGEKNTMVQVQVEGSNVLFRVLQAERGAGKPFGEIDRWSIPQRQIVEQGAQPDAK